ncbi:hypothetical protein ANCCEY_06935 [Ancylostoma ceylanicum]|uniref:ethanolamine kinase n=1 Tax=Ancylostoma ceylanicum TaxID=53326 RepID=A0A0D6LRZ7_9BILA|nr:hypothetical protein ANCCEY_06935 [Ancylostoma ceylanicum]
MDAPAKVIDDLFPFRKTRDFIRNIDVSAAKDVLHFANQLSHNLEEIQSLVVPLNEEITFCHNDLLAHNIIFDECSGKLETGFIYNIIAGTVLFIDYEYADFNYAIFDLANHFCEFAGNWLHL